uniref:Uncharacterized protein n=1 Tax=Cacopsylla melanoneura TaxID=428564 RepID=A0A8D8QW94_9HEMI
MYHVCVPLKMTWKMRLHRAKNSDQKRVLFESRTHYFQNFKVLTSVVGTCVLAFCIWYTLVKTFKNRLLKARNSDQKRDYLLIREYYLENVMLPYLNCWDQ